MFLNPDEPAFEAVCAAVAINRPSLPLSKVQETAGTLAANERVAYLALCVACDSEPQDKLTAMVARLLEKEGQS